jgi:hypothetical protein
MEGAFAKPPPQLCLMYIRHMADQWKDARWWN